MRLTRGTCLGTGQGLNQGLPGSGLEIEGYVGGIKRSAGCGAQGHTRRAAVIGFREGPVAQLLARVAADVVAPLVEQATPTALEIAVLQTLIACTRYIVHRDRRDIRSSSCEND